MSLLLSGSQKTICGGWGFSSVVECLPRKRKALGSVPSSEKKNQKKKKKKTICKSWFSKDKVGFLKV